MDQNMIRKQVLATSPNDLTLAEAYDLGKRICLLAPADKLLIASSLSPELLS